MIRRPRTRFRRRTHGGYELHLPEEERLLLARLPLELAEALGGLEDPSAVVPDTLRRLFPTAYPTDDQAESVYLMGARRELAAHHRESLATLVSTADAKSLSEEDAQAWLAALNDLRLSLGSTLDVTEAPRELDPQDPHYTEWICYHYLSYLQGELIDAVSASLPAAEVEESELPDDPWGDPLGGLRWDGTDLPPQL